MAISALDRVIIITSFYAVMHYLQPIPTNYHSKVLPPLHFGFPFPKAELNLIFEATTLYWSPYIQLPSPGLLPSCFSSGLRRALEQAKLSDDIVVVAGSFYLMPEAREELGITEPRDQCTYQ